MPRTAQQKHRVNLAAQRELERLFQRHRGKMKLEQVVEYAAREDSPLHYFFEWDDSEAARRWRISEARRLVQNTFKVTQVEGSEVQVFRFAVSLPSDRDSRTYRRTVDVLSVPEQRAELLESAKRDFLALRRRYAMLEELSELFAHIDALDEAS